MANVIKHKRGSGSDPVANDLVVGEVAIRTDVGKLFTKMDNGSVAEIAGGGSDIAINTLSSSSGTGGGSATFNGSAFRFTLSAPPSVSAQQLLVSINGVIQKPVAGTGQPSEGFSVDGTDIILGAAPATGSDFFILTFKSLGVSEPADNSVTSAKIVDGAIATADIANDAITTAKIAANAVTASRILDSTIQESKINNGAVTVNKIASNAVNSFKIADGAVTSAKIADGAIVNADINASAAIAVSKLATFVNNNADNRVITGSGTANTLNGESNLTVGAQGDLHIKDPGNTSYTNFTGSTDAGIIIGNGLLDSAGVQIRTNTSGSCKVNFGDGDGSSPNRSKGFIHYTHSDDSMQIGTNSSERMRIDSSGRVGIGTSSPGSYNSNFDNFVIRGSGNTGMTISTDDNSFGQIAFSNAEDAHVSGAIQYRNSDNILELRAGESNGAVIFSTVSNTERMRIDSSGRVLVGTSTQFGDGNDKLMIEKGTDGGRIAFGTSAGFSECIIGQVSAYWADNKKVAAISFFGGSDTSNKDDGTIRFATSSANNLTERMRINSSGQISIGDDATPMTAAAIHSNYLQALTGQSMVGIVSNQTSHPANTNNIPAQARSIVGAITRQCYIGTRRVGTNNPAGFLYIQQRDGGNTHIWADNNAKIRTSNDAGQIGSTSGTVVGSQTSDIRLKNNLGSVSYGLTEINKIIPIKYTFRKDESSRQQLGFSAQDIQSIIPESVYDTKETDEVESEEVKNILAMDYVALIPVLVNAVKELSTKVQALEAK